MTREVRAKEARTGKPKRQLLYSRDCPARQFENLAGLHFSQTICSFKVFLTVGYFTLSLKGLQ